MWWGGLSTVSRVDQAETVTSTGLQVKGQREVTEVYKIFNGSEKDNWVRGFLLKVVTLSG